MRIAQSNHQVERLIFLSAALASILLSFWSSWRETVINPDAICYLLSADAIMQSGWSAVGHTCPQANWPFYSIMIFYVTHVFSFSTLLSAYLLDGLFSLISVITFIYLVKELGGRKRVLWLAAFVILLSHEFNSVRQYIVRDHGFWAFYLLSIFFLLRYLRHPQWFFAWGFNISLLVATLFRVEGVFFLLIVPFVFLIILKFSFKQRMQYFLMLYTPLLLGCLGLVAWYLLSPSPLMTNHLGRLVEVGHQLRHGAALISTSFATAKIGLAQHVLAKEAARDAGLLLSLALVIWYVVYVMINLSWGYVGLIIYACYKRVVSFEANVMMVLGAYLMVNVGITFVFFTQHLFLSKRYLIALSFILMLFVPFALQALLTRWHQRETRFFFMLTVLLILFSASGAIINFGYSKKYIHEAGDWIAANVPMHTSLYANDYQLMYYSKHFGQDIFRQLPIYLNMNILLNQQWKRYDYLAFRLDKNNAANVSLIAQSIQLTPEKIFMNSRGDRVVIYKVQEKIS